MKNDILRVNVYGESLEAKTVTACLAHSGFYATNYQGLFCDLPCHENRIISEPKLEAMLNADKSSVQLVDGLNNKDRADIHWVVYKGKNTDSLVNFMLSLVQGKRQKQHVILTTNLGIGTHNIIKSKINELSSTLDLSEQHEIISIPTFFREGSAIDDFFSPPILLVGTEFEASKSIVSSLLPDTIKNASDVRFMTGTEVEIVNNAVSAFLAMRVSFINELATLLESKHVDFKPIMEAMSCDPRFGKYYNQAGCGFGGVALQEAVVNMQSLFKDFSSGSLMMQATLDINENQKDMLFRKFWQFNASKISQKKVAIWGATFRANTSSTVNSPVINLINALTSENVEVNLYDPMMAGNNPNSELFHSSINIFSSMYEAIKDVDALFIVTDWQEFKSAELEKIKKLLRVPVIFDGRNIYEPSDLEKIDLTYFGVGRSYKK